MVEHHNQLKDILESRLKVSCLAQAPVVARQWNPSNVISLLDPCLAANEIPVFSSASHSVYRFFDQESIQATAHLPQIGTRLRLELTQVLSVPDSRLLIHCHAGASRSTAAALVAICLLRPDISGAHAFDALLQLCTKPWPNRRLIDALSHGMSQSQDLLKAVDQYRDAHPKRLQAYRRLNLKRGIVSPVQR